MVSYDDNIIAIYLYHAQPQLVKINHNGGWPTFQHILLHLNFVELVGADNDAVASEVDTAAGLRCLDLLQKQTKVQHLLPTHYSGTEQKLPFISWH